ncbi:hypothetical protein SAMN04489806_1676 [Paramicrobacterium humi]|uniref:Uncharacterized protein n=2 Tax=Paramicrobacterium humi TaxID=640635 RepID=A0A1H4LVU2_9MICO|nr:hypothetical protein SAMN04489806_1676 [Microbacterium humi]
MDEYYPEFVVLERPLAIFSKPDGQMETVNSIEGMIAITIHAGRHPEYTPMTFRVPNELERYSRLKVSEKTYVVELGTHLEHHKISKRPAPSKKKTKRDGPREAVPLEGIDAATIMFLWLNRGKLPKWADLQSLGRLP